MILPELRERTRSSADWTAVAQTRPLCPEMPGRGIVTYSGIEQRGQCMNRVARSAWQARESQTSHTGTGIQRGDESEDRHVLGRAYAQDPVRKPKLVSQHLHRHRRRRRFRNVDQCENGNTLAKRCANPVRASSDVDDRRAAGTCDLVLAPTRECKAQRLGALPACIERRRQKRHAMPVAPKMTERPEGRAVMEPYENAWRGWKRIALDHEIAVHPAVAARRGQCRIDVVDEARQPMPDGPRFIIAAEAQARARRVSARGFGLEEPATSCERPQGSPRERPRHHRRKRRQHHALGNLSAPVPPGFAPGRVRNAFSVRSDHANDARGEPARIRVNCRGRPVRARRDQTRAVLPGRRHAP